MSDKTIMVEVVTPERLVLAESTELVVVPGVEGYLGVLRLHSPMVAALNVGVMKTVAGGVETKMAIGKGIVEVNDNKVVVLTDSAELASEIDVERALAARDRAKERLRNITPMIDEVRAEMALTRALTRLKVTGHIQ